MEALGEWVRRTRGAMAIPVDVERIAAGCGIRVCRMQWRGLPHAVSLICPMVILLNGNRPPCSRRFDLAHELYHFMKIESYHSEEANRFAAALLMPEAEMRWAIARCGSEDGRARALFGVSEYAWRLRLKDLGPWPG